MSKPKPRKGPNRPRCGARTNAKREGRPCRREAGWGTDHPGYGNCKLHGGNSPNGRLHAIKLEARAEAAKAVGVVPEDLSPDTALNVCLRLAAGEVEYLTAKVESLSEDEAIVTSRKTKTRPRKLRDGESATETVQETTTSTDAQLHPWIRARQEAMDRLARYALMSIQAGLAERELAAAEQLGNEVARFIQAVLADLDLTAEQQTRAPVVVHRHLALLEGGKSPSHSK
ncbi:MAG TPA: hypothetical protein VFT50_14170 [Baekduia sp.]|nr:hypothetical protein [Baekduia sp.]